MADLEGYLETRGPGKVGKWEQFWFKLGATAMSCYDVTDTARISPRNAFSLKDISDLVEDLTKREFSFEVGGVKARFRASDFEMGNRWFSTLQAKVSENSTPLPMSPLQEAWGLAPSSPPTMHRGEGPRYYWIQCDNIGDLPSNGNTPGSYVIRARWRSALDAHETDPRPGAIRTCGPVDVEDCFVRQQVLLTANNGQRTVLVSVVRKDDDESALIGTCELNVENPDHRAAATYQLLNRKGERVGVDVRLKVKVADPTMIPLQDSVVRAASPGVSPAMSNRTPPGSPRSTNQALATVPDAAGSPQALFTTTPLSPRLSQSRASLARSRSSSVRRATQEEFDASMVPGMLDSLIRVMDVNKLRVADMFRHPQYNPAFLETRTETLDAKSLEGVFKRAGLDFEPRSCRMLVRCLDENGDGTVGIGDLENAVRARRRGRDKWYEVLRKENDSKLNWHRGAAKKEVAQNSPEACLNAISDLLDTRHIRVHDLFRHPHYNPAYLETGEETFDADLMTKVLTKAGLELSPADVEKLINTIDADLTGTVDIDELEHVLRNYRRGNKIWESEDFIKSQKQARKQLAKRKRTKSQQQEAALRLYVEHQEKLARRELGRAQRDKDEDTAIAKGIETNRLGSRRQGASQQVVPLDSFKGLELHDQLQEIKERHKQLVRQAREEEHKKIMATKPPASYRAVSPRDRDGQNEEPISERLYNMALERRELLKQRQVEHEAMQLNTLKQNDRTIRLGIDDDRCVTLFEDAKHRRDRIEELSRHKAIEEVRYWGEMAERKQTFQPSAKEHDERILELHQLHDRKMKAMVDAREKKEAKERSDIQKATLKARSMSPRMEKLKAQVPSRWHEPANHPPDLKDQIKKRLDQATDAMGFGSSTPRSRCFFQDQIKPVDYEEKTQVSYPMHTAADHCIETVNAMVATRTGNLAAAAHSEELQALAAQCGEALEIFNEALVNCKNLTAAAALDLMPSQRIYNDKELVPDDIGFQHCVEPCPLMQRTEDLDTLLDEGDKAHWALLAKIGPQDTQTMSQIDVLELIRKRWPAGSRWHHPVAAKGATFAYHPGPKSRQAAWCKAFTRYGPTVGETRHRHLLDLARCTLVFPNQTLLRSGLQQLIQQFRVVGVHNYYHPRHQNLLGYKYISVYVIITEYLETPHICEIRLQEAAYFAAWQDVEPIVDAMGTKFAEIYGHLKTTTPPGCIQYLVKHLLTHPRPPHSLQVFRKHVAKRWGSSVVAWRKMFTNSPTANFLHFRDVCQQLKLRRQTVEYWTELDCTLAGCISLFDLDPMACALLARFYSHLLGSVENDAEATPEMLFQKLATRLPNNRSNKPGQLEAHEFRQCLKVFGFNWQEADKIFQFLDNQGGSARVAPASVTVKDIGWLRNLNELVNIDMAMLTAGTASDTQMLRMLQQAGLKDSTLRGHMPQEKRSSTFLSSTAQMFTDQQLNSHKEAVRQQSDIASRAISQSKAARRASVDDPNNATTEPSGASSMGSLGSPRSPGSPRSLGSSIDDEESRGGDEDGESEYDEDDESSEDPLRGLPRDEEIDDELSGDDIESPYEDEAPPRPPSHAAVGAQSRFSDDEDGEDGEEEEEDYLSSDSGNY